MAEKAKPTTAVKIITAGSKVLTTVKKHKKEILAATVAGGSLTTTVVASKKVINPLLQDRTVRKLRKLELNAENKLNLEGIPVGSVLICELKKYSHHSGIYLGHGKVAELFGDGKYQSVSLEEFIHGAPGENYRTGTHAFVACNADGKPLGSPEVAKCARRFVGSETEYELTTNNCHLFSATCHANGEIQKISGPKRIIKTFSIGKLCCQIQTFHKTEKLRWLPIENVQITHKFIS